MEGLTERSSPDHVALQLHTFKETTSKGGVSISHFPLFPRDASTPHCNSAHAIVPSRRRFDRWKRRFSGPLLALLGKTNLGQWGRLPTLDLVFFFVVLGVAFPWCHGPAVLAVHCNRISSCNESCIRRVGIPFHDGQTPVRSSLGQKNSLSIGSFLSKCFSEPRAGQFLT